MVEVTIDSILWIEDIPEEYTKEALSLGLITPGKRIGVNVKTNDGRQADIDLIPRYGEEGLVREGAKVDITQCNEAYYFKRQWVEAIQDACV